MCSGLAASSAGVVAALEAVRLGKSPPQAIRVVYREEQPLARTIEVAVGGDGDVRVTSATLRPGCARPAFADCWRRSVRTSRLAAERHRRLVSVIPAREIAALPREEAVAPGAPRVSLTVDGGAAGRLEAQCSLETAARYPGFARWRDRMLRVAAAAGRPPP